MCEILIGRPLAPFEKEVFLFPRACRVCRLAKNMGMKECEFCAGVAYCSEQCMEENIEKHKEAFCTELKYAMVCDNYESTVSVAAPPIPSDLDKTYNDSSLLKSNMKKYLDLLNRLDQYKFEDDEGRTVNEATIFDNIV